jgi:hypothetical protein
MLQDTAYHQAKANIMQPISEFYLMMEQRTQAIVHTAQTNALRLRMVFIVFGLLLAQFYSLLPISPLISLMPTHM